MTAMRATAVKRAMMGEPAENDSQGSLVKTRIPLSMELVAIFSC
jgi:hypothetical protein